MSLFIEMLSDGTLLTYHFIPLSTGECTLALTSGVLESDDREKGEN
jgi:hypothetical protein